MTDIKVKSAPLTDFSKHLDDLGEKLRSSGSVVGHCVLDIGLFGLVGQAFGAGASIHCDKARDQLESYAGTLGEFADRLRDAARRYEDSDNDAEVSISRFTP
ncbi:type VII secretion target [Prauserella oleivorans]|uniref:Type VII secretion target n=1 Tax=Prauserella oleivorans TaxID=1478153 RepID=A0ABW5WES1_9PSEU